MSSAMLDPANSTLHSFPSVTLAELRPRREGLRSSVRTPGPDPSPDPASSSNSEVFESSHISSNSANHTPARVPISITPRIYSPSSSDEDIMTARLNESRNIELSSGKYGPRVKPTAILSPEDLDDLYEDARRYSKLRSEETIENVREVIADAFPARVHRDWFRAEKSLHLALALEVKDPKDESSLATFPFLDALCRKFCGHDWAQVHSARRDDLRMSVGGVGCFDDYLSQVEGCNNRLKGVGNYLTPAQLLTILARGISATLTAILSEQGIVIDETTVYKDWITACRDLEVRFKTRLVSADRTGRRGNFTPNASGGQNNVPLHKRMATSEPTGHPNKRSTTDTLSSATGTGPFYMRAFSKMPEC
ncbi:hypothetical protein F5877DRAFT_80568 [Lentinula edodes]|nr:hypothetical protein F5877DRAFT_80568 [Lentinula edodes]